MSLDIVLILSVLISLFAGFVSGFLFLKKKLSLNKEKLEKDFNELKLKYEYLEKENIKNQEIINDINAKITKKDNEYAQLREKAVRLKEQASVIPELKQKNENYSAQLEKFRQDFSKEASLRSAAEERAGRLEKTEDQLNQKNEKIEELNEELSNIKSDYSELQTRLEEQTNYISEQRQNYDKVSKELEEIREKYNKESELRAKAEEKNHYLYKTEEALAEKEENVNSLNESLSKIKSDYSELQTRLEEQTNYISEQRQNYDKVSKELEEIREKYNKESELRAKAEEKNHYLYKTEEALAEKEKNVNSLNESLSKIKSDYSELQTRLEEQKKYNDERLKDLEEAKKGMKFEFESLASKILEEKSKKFTDQNKLNIGELIKPVKDQLGDFSKKVAQIHLEETKDRTALSEQIKNLQNINQEMNKEAKNLTKALTGENKIQGNWGEMILEKILEKSGLRKGEEYETQGSFRDSENKLLRPDVIVHLPDKKDIVIDSKVSLVSYNKYINSVDEEEKNKALSDHILSVKTHINGLAQKDYQSLEGIKSLDFIMMFMPIDAAFMAAFQHDEQLFNLAFQKRIVIVTPTTLLATLRTVENIWKYERQNENAREIARRAGKIYDKLRGFLEDFEKIEKNINTLQTTYETAYKKLHTGKGNLINQAEHLKSYGIPYKKEIPVEFVENADLEDIVEAEI